MNQQAYLKLVQDLNDHAHAYYVLARPSISDASYDALYRELEALEREHPEWIVGHSPTQRVGSPVVSSLPEIPHQQPMLSLDNAFSEEEVAHFAKRCQEKVQEEIVWVCEPKYDGVAVAIRFEQGHFALSISRGDGHVGEDITHAVRTIKNLPLRLKGESLPEHLEVRGEVYIEKKAFDRLNQVQSEAGELTFANPRNACAGSLRQLDPSVIAERPLTLVCYAMIDPMSHGLSTHWQALQALKAWGLPTGGHSQRCQSVSECLAYHRSLLAIRDDLPHEIDGVLYKVNDYKAQEEIGYVARAPRWAIAHKFPAIMEETTVENIDFQVGRTGVLTPVARLKSVKVSGVTITNATLHNMSELHRKDVRIGDCVKVRRAGDVIPEVVEVVLSKRPLEAEVVSMPAHCPECRAEVRQVEDEVAYYCQAGWACPPQRMGALVHFISRNALDVSGFGPKLVAQCVEAGLLTTWGDLYRLTHEALKTLERMGDKSSALCIKSIEKSKKTTLPRLIYALGVRHVGLTTAKHLAHHFKSMDALLAADETSLCEVEEVGPIVAKAWIQFVETHHARIMDLLSCGLSWPEIKIETNPSMGGPLIGEASVGPLMGRTFVLTGTLQGYKRDEVRTLLESKGGVVLSQVSKKVTDVIVGEKAGSKWAKAKALGLNILDEAALVTLLDQ